jgi:chromosome partitioning protein
MDDDVNGSIYHVFTGDAKLSEIIISGIVHPTTQQVINSNLHLAPANIGMTNIEGMQISSKERRLLFAIEEVINDYDYIIIDTPPSLGTLSVASYIAADYILIPNNPDKVSTMGLTLLLNTLSEVRKFHLAKIEIIGVMFSRWNNTKANTETRTILVDKLFKEKMFKTVIPHGTQIDQAQYAYLPITLFDPRSKISQAYENLVDELLTRINMKVVAVNG